MKKTRVHAPALVGVLVSVVAFSAGPALAARINKCTTISKPGFYVVTRNLTATGDCLVVAANFVTIDLGGWVITGNGNTETGGVTDRGAGRGGITVRNGTITGFFVGVDLRASSVVIEKVQAISNIELGIFTGGGSIVTGNTSVGGTFGIFTGDNSIVSGNIANGIDVAMRVGTVSTVSGNNASAEDVGLSVGLRSTVSGNTARGEVSIGAGPGSTVSGNTVHGFNGIVAELGSTVSGNTAAAGGNPGEGIGIEAICPSNVIGNTATGYGSNLVLSGAGCTNIDNLAP